jgi:hypothetical protein
MTKITKKCQGNPFGYLDIEQLVFIWDLRFGYWNLNYPHFHRAMTKVIRKTKTRFI